MLKRCKPRGFGNLFRVNWGKADVNDRLLVLTCHHKDDPFINISKELFFPVQAGAALSSQDLGIAKDNDGTHISEKNPYYSELTALYWAWKNTSSDYVGLMHYRQFFSNDRPLGFEAKNIARHVQNFVKNRVFRTTPYYSRQRVYYIPSFSHAEGLARDFRAYLDQNIDKYDVFVPRKIYLYGVNVRQHYALYHNNDDLDVFERILKERHPELGQAHDEVMTGNWMYTYNMFITNRQIFDEYCAVLFDILFEMEKVIDIKAKTDYQKRIFGFISERFLNIYLRDLERKGKRLKELSTYFINA